MPALDDLLREVAKPLGANQDADRLRVREKRQLLQFLETCNALK